LRRVLRLRLHWRATGTCSTWTWPWRTASGGRQSAAWAAQVHVGAGIIWGIGDSRGTDGGVAVGLLCHGEAGCCQECPCLVPAYARQRVGCCLGSKSCIRVSSMTSNNVHARGNGQPLLPVCTASACAARVFPATPPGFGAAAFMGPLLQNLCLSMGNNEEACFCLKVGGGTQQGTAWHSTAQQGTAGHSRHCLVQVQSAATQGHIR
jgi:hypothetical protein